MILDKEIYVIDDFIDLEYQEDIRTILMADINFKGKIFLGIIFKMLQQRVMLIVRIEQH